MKSNGTFALSTVLRERGVAKLILSKPFHLLQVISGGFFLFTLSVCFAHAQQQAVATNPGNKYVGAEECKTCHEDIYSGFEKSPHWKTLFDKRGGASKQGCEGCH